MLPAAIPSLSDAALEGVKDGDMAMAAYAEAIQPSITVARREELRLQRQKYCELDIYAMVRLWQFLSGRTDMKL